MSDRVLYQDRFLTLLGDDDKTYVHGKDGTQCVPLTDSGRVICIVEPSPAFGRDILTLPGGQIERHETPAIAANRKLQEEIGYYANQLDYLGELRPWIKYLRASIYIYLARDLTPSNLGGDGCCNLATELIHLDDFERLIEQGRLQDSSVIAAFYRARAFLNK
jgi:ADP-ribose pyrophosphatase